MRSKIKWILASLLLVVVFKPQLVELLRQSPISSRLIGPAKSVAFSKDIPGVTVDGYVAIVPRGRITQAQGLVITESDQVLLDNANDWSKPSPDQLNILHRLALPRVQRSYPGRVAVVTTKGAECYYHWMLEVLPKLHLLQHQRYDKLYFPQLRFAFQKESLQALHICSDQIIEADAHTMIEADDVLVPTRLEPQKWMITYLRSLFLKSDAPSGPKRIYISRSCASRRRILNEPALLPILAAHGFTTIYAEKLTVEQQAALFHSADVIIAPHGAAFTNIVFCRPGTRIIELMHPQHYVECYKSLAQLVDVQRSEILLSDAGGKLDGVVDPALFEAELKASLGERNGRAGAAGSFGWLRGGDGGNGEDVDFE